MKKSRIISETAQVCAAVRAISTKKKRDEYRDLYLRAVARFCRKI